MGHFEAAGFFRIGMASSKATRECWGAGSNLKGRRNLADLQSKSDKVSAKSSSVSPGKPTMNVAGDADRAFGGLHPGDAFEILIAAVEALHGGQDAVRSALHGQ